MIASAGTLTFSFDGKDDHGAIVAADGWQEFPNVAKGTIYVKGSAAFKLMAWSGSTM